MWIVNLKGTAKSGGEIAVVESSNEFGLDSYGWADDEKFIVLRSSHDEHHPRVWSLADEAAVKLANELNQGKETRRPKRDSSNRWVYGFY